MNVNFFQAIGSFYRNYATFTGRSTRAEYWWVQLYLLITNLILLFVPLVIIIAVGMSNRPMFYYGSPFSHVPPVMWLLLIPGIIFCIINIVPGIALFMRRMHDIGYSGWWYLYFCLMGMGANIFGALVNMSTHSVIGSLIGNLLSLAISIWQLVLLVRESEWGYNDYGPNPYGEGNDYTEE